MKRHLSSMFGLVWLVACGGGEGGELGTGPISAADAQPLCQADCQRDFDCGNETDVAACTTQCVDDIEGWVRGDAAETIFECFAGLACGEIDDGCATLVQPLAIHEEWEGRCRAAIGTCDLDPGQIEFLCEVSPGPDDEIGFMRFVAPPIVEELFACEDAADCTGRVNCVLEVLDSHGVDL